MEKEVIEFIESRIEYHKSKQKEYANISEMRVEQERGSVIALMVVKRKLEKLFKQDAK